MMEASVFHQHEILRVKRQIAELQDYLKVLESADINSVPIDELFRDSVPHNTRIRTLNVLRMAKCETIGDVALLLRSAKLFELRQVGEKTASVVITALRQWGIDVER